MLLPIKGVATPRLFATSLKDATHSAKLTCTPLQSAPSIEHRSASVPRAGGQLVSISPRSMLVSHGKGGAGLNGGWRLSRCTSRPPKDHTSARSDSSRPMNVPLGLCSSRRASPKSTSLTCRSGSGPSITFAALRSPWMTCRPCR